MSRGQYQSWLLSSLACLVLAVSIVVTGIWVVSAQHEARQLFAELEELNRENDRLQIDWGRLQLEQSAHATHSLIESVARERLAFGTPDPNLRVVIEEPAR